jgi:hypothetical protein
MFAPRFPLRGRSGNLANCIQRLEERIIQWGTPCRLTGVKQLVAALLPALADKKWTYLPIKWRCMTVLFEGLHR